MNSRVLFSLILAATILNSGCGGGGGGGSSSEPPTGNPNPPDNSGFSINVDNAVNVSREVVRTSFSLGEFPIITSDIIVGAVSHVENQQFNLSDFAINLFLKRFDPINDVVIGASFEVTEPCEEGEITMSGDRTDPETNTEGDYATFIFSNCVDGSGITINGTIDIELTDKSEGEIFVAPYSYSLSLDLSNLTVTTNGESITSNGDMQYSESAQDNDVYTATISGDSLSFATSDETTTLLNFENTTIHNDLTRDYSIDISGSLESSALGGTVDFITIEPLEGTYPNDADAGVLLITGDNDSSLQLIVHDAVNISLEVDTDGDDIVDDTIPTNWDELEN